MRRPVVLVLALALGSVAFSRPAAFTWPAWISIESPPNPFERDNRGVLLLVHAMTREGAPAASDLNGSAQGIVAGTRRSMRIEFDATPKAGVFAVRRQWPAEGTWLLEISLGKTTAVVVLDHEGSVASVRVPTQLQGSNPIPRVVTAQEIDSTLAAAARR